MENRVATWWVRIYMAGPLAVAEQVCREECRREGLCVTIEATKFIYSGGEEAGFVVQLLNYPRFPQLPNRLLERARELALQLRERTCQDSFLLMTPELTEWNSLRES